MDTGLRSGPMADLGLTDDMGLGDCLLHVTHHQFTADCWQHAAQWLFYTRDALNLSPAGRVERYRQEYEGRVLVAAIRDVWSCPR